MQVLIKQFYWNWNSGFIESERWFSRLLWAAVNKISLVNGARKAAISMVLMSGKEDKRSSSKEPLPSGNWIVVYQYRDATFENITRF